MEITDKMCCSVFLVKPSSLVIKFDPEQSLENVNGNFKVINNSSKPQRLLITPPVTEYFLIEYSNPGWLYSGDQISVSVILKAVNSHRIYYDCVKIKCSLGCRTEASIEAIPWHPYLIQIPKEINFGHVFLGEMVSRRFKLEVTKEHQPFLFVIPSENQSLTINPSKGKIKTEPADILIIYTPTSYTTACIPVLLYMPNVLTLPYYFCVTAFTKPGALRDKIISEKTCEQKTQIQKKCLKYFAKKPVHSILTIIPEDNLPLWSHHKTNHYMLQKEKPQKSPDELLGPLGKYLDHEQLIKKSKEDSFICNAKDERKENISALAHHREKLKDETGVVCDEIEMWKEYMVRVQLPLWEKMYESAFIRQRVIEKYNQKAELNFTNVHADLWFVRYLIMCKFIELVRKVIVLNRMVRRLNIFKGLSREDIELYEFAPFKL